MNHLTVRLTILALAALVISLALGLHSGAPEVREWRVKHEHLPSIRIALFSDFHFSAAKDMEILAVLKRQLINRNVDLILFAGDYIGSHAIYDDVSRETIIKSLEALAFPKPSFAVLGNHDNWDSNYAWKQAFSGSTVTLLENQLTQVELKDTRICIRGLGDLYSGYWKPVEIPIECENITVTLTHDPAGLLSPENSVLTLSVAGHTHCGQIEFPFIGAPIVPTKAPRDMHCGQFNRGAGGVVSGGLGSSIIPLRFGPNTQVGWELILIQHLE